MIGLKVTEEISDCESSDGDVNADGVVSRVSKNDSGDRDDQVDNTTIMKELKTFHRKSRWMLPETVIFSYESNYSNPEGSRSSHSNASIEPQPCTSNEYKIVGDNNDKNIRASFQQLDHQTKLLHYFQTFAVRDCIDSSRVSNMTPHYVKIDPATVLPKPADRTALLKELEVIACRYVCNLCRYLTIVLIIIRFLCGV